jgi:uncharacterized Zn finger protein (UPF0148 family)
MLVEQNTMGGQVICAHCDIPNFRETVSGLCPMCGDAARDASVRAKIAERKEATDRERDQWLAKVAARCQVAAMRAHLEVWREQLGRGEISLVLAAMDAELKKGEE